MAKKNLGQSNPAADTPTSLYTVPASKEAVVSTFSACNLSDTETATIQLAHRVSGAALANSMYVYKILEVPPGETFAATLGITLATTDIVHVQSDTANIAFNLWGDESDA